MEATPEEPLKVTPEEPQKIYTLEELSARTDQIEKVLGSLAGSTMRALDQLAKVIAGVAAKGTTNQKKLLLPPQRPYLRSP